MMSQNEGAHSMKVLPSPRLICSDDHCVSVQSFAALELTADSADLRASLAVHLISSCMLNFSSRSVLLLLLSVCCNSFADCLAPQICQQSFDRLQHLQSQALQSQDSFTYFLHIPRTAGRTLWSCFLKPGLPIAKRCAKSYDTLRFAPGNTGCGLLSSHDDYSMVHSILPENTTSITQLRDPVDRVLSAYEFSVEVAARFEISPPNATRQRNKTLTTEVWPWSSLVPLIQQDIAHRVCHPVEMFCMHTSVRRLCQGGLASSNFHGVNSDCFGPCVLCNQPFCHYKVNSRVFKCAEGEQKEGK